MMRLFKPSPPPPNDSFTEDGAKKLAHAIERYWAQRGFEVECRLVKNRFLSTQRSTWFSIESDMMNALPRRAKQEDAA